MGKTRNERKLRKELSSNIQSHINNGEYDLESNFRKIRPYTQRSRKKNLSMVLLIAVKISGGNDIRRIM